MILIIGLGNPGPQYSQTRHNVGFMAADALRERFKLGGFRNESKFKAEVARGTYRGKKVIVARPQTFMNLSGEAVLLLKQFYKIPSENIWVVYDDVDLPLGTLRIRDEGSAGTHNGMKSIIQTLATEVFPRFRLGIESRGEVAPTQQGLSSFVLEAFRNEEIPQVNTMLDAFVDASVMALTKGLEEAKTAFSH